MDYKTAARSHEFNRKEGSISSLINKSTINSFEAGYEYCQKEYEEKLRWIPVEEKLPEFNDSEYPNGNFEEYEVKFCTGGMSPKYFIRISHLINKAKFSGEFDWTHATHWRRIL